MAQIQLFIGQAGAFPTEHQRALRLLALARQCLGRAPGIEVGTRQRPRPRTQAGDPMAARQCGGQVDMNLGAFEDVIGSGGHGRGLGIGELLWGDQMQLGESHGLHRPGGGADVARVGGRHQHDTGRPYHGSRVVSLARDSACCAVSSLFVSARRLSGMRSAA